MRVTSFLYLLPLLSFASALQPISRVGRYLYGADGKRFLIKGVSYQEQGTIAAPNDQNAFPEPTNYVDPLADGAACKRDLPFLTGLGVNAIRVYSVNSSLNHDVCMNLFSQANIYTIIDLSLPVTGSVDRASPAWTTNLLDQYLQTVEVFSKYDNVLAFNVGNEVVTGTPDTVAAPFVKAAARDIKAYLHSKSSSVLVGFASTDGDDTWLVPLATYLAADSDATSLDIFGLNNYEWCGNSSFQGSYSFKTNDFAGYNVVAYFSEFGCTKVLPRIWTEVGALFGPNMTNVWSGGVAFSYFQAVGNYGLVNISSDEATVQTGTDYANLKGEYALVTFTNTPTEAQAPPAAFPPYPTQNSSFLASPDLPPTPDDAICGCLVNTSFSCVFTPQTTNTSVILGQLLDFGCSSLGQMGANCDEIAGDGATGTYGDISFCDPSTKLSYVMSALYELTDRNPQTCNFNGNASVNPMAPSTQEKAQAAASACLAEQGGPTFVPIAPPMPTIINGTSPTIVTTTNKSAALSLLWSFEGVTPLMVAFGTLGAGFVAGVWTTFV